MNVSPSLLSEEARQANEQKKEAAQRVREEFKPPGVVSCVIGGMRPDGLYLQLQVAGTFLREQRGSIKTVELMPRTSAEAKQKTLEQQLEKAGENREGGSLWDFQCSGRAVASRIMEIYGDDDC